VADGDHSNPLTWDEANLPLERAASLIALADGLCAIGRVRDGKDAGQFSIHNFLLRAAVETHDDAVDGGTDSGGSADFRPMVVMMRAGVMRRHAWYMRVHHDGDGRQQQIDLPSPIDADWEWWPNIEEIQSRLIDEPVWASSVGATFDERCRVIALALESVRLTRIDAVR
jgi:hypothetical protein